MESETKCGNSDSRKYGEIHGTAFFFSGDDANGFLDYMQGIIIHWEDYYDGFLEGLTGRQKDKHRAMKKAAREFAQLKESGWQELVEEENYDTQRNEIPN